MNNQMIKLFKKLRRKPRIEEVYEFGPVVGQGAFSVVREGTHRETGEKVAIKQIAKQHITTADMKRLATEIEIMKKLKHNNIIQLIEVFDNSPDNLYLVMELVKGGELFDKIVDKGQYSEKDACNIVKQIVAAVQYMHDHGVCHRDLKPENLLCAGDDNEELVRIADFGLSKIFEHGEELKTACGTPDYVAPEVLECKPYDMAVDIWSVGVITYILLCGYTPFYANTHQELFQKITNLEYDFPSPEWDEISPNAKDFIQKVLVKDPNKRLNAAQCMQHPWMTQEHADAPKLCRLDSALVSLKDYSKTRKTSFLERHAQLSLSAPQLTPYS
eukprot:Phypoly_transcript_13147.p1 GENE.Phypoly_transcript_13147~~Phypoly_transcript_13147.p1  ORF type:complete len:350 (+),score=62.81 Phypoly_transcript_13147:63-1052(+)